MKSDEGISCMSSLFIDWIGCIEDCSLAEMFLISLLYLNDETCSILALARYVEYSFPVLLRESKMLCRDEININDLGSSSSLCSILRQVAEGRGGDCCREIG